MFRKNSQLKLPKCKQLWRENTFNDMKTFSLFINERCKLFNKLIKRGQCSGVYPSFEENTVKRRKEDYKLHTYKVQDVGIRLSIC